MNQLRYSKIAIMVQLYNVAISRLLNTALSPSSVMHISWWLERGRPCTCSHSHYLGRLIYISNRTRECYASRSRYIRYNYSPYSRYSSLLPPHAIIICTHRHVIITLSKSARSMSLSHQLTQNDLINFLKGLLYLFVFVY